MIIPLISDEKAEAQEHLATRQGHMGRAAQHERVSVARPLTCTMSSLGQQGARVPRACPLGVQESYSCFERKIKNCVSL